MHAVVCGPVRAKSGMQVHIEHTIALEDGTVIDSGDVEFVCGEGLLMPGLDQGLQGMAVGEDRQLQLTPDQAYGPKDDRKILNIPASQLPPGCKVGQALNLPGQELYAQIIAVNTTYVTIDYNHPLAGLPLLVSVKLLSCQKAAGPPQLLVETMSPGDGKTYPQMGDFVTVHYTGQLAAGSNEFESTRKHGVPFRFQIGLGEVIKGWDHAIVRMSLGERAMINVPAMLAYGAEGMGDKIPPNADLVFDVELLKIE